MTTSSCWEFPFSFDPRLLLNSIWIDFPSLTGVIVFIYSQPLPNLRTCNSPRWQVFMLCPVACYLPFVPPLVFSPRSPLQAIYMDPQSALPESIYFAFRFLSVIRKSIWETLVQYTGIVLLIQGNMLNNKGISNLRPNLPPSQMEMAQKVQR